MLTPDRPEYADQFRRLFAVPDPVPPSLRARVAGWLLEEWLGNRGRWLRVVLDYAVVLSLMLLIDLGTHMTTWATVWSLLGMTWLTHRVRARWRDYLKEHDDDRHR